MNGHASFNRSYTVVWSDTHQAYVVTHEATRRKGKRSGAISRPVAQALLAAFAAFGGGGAIAGGVVPTTVVPTGGNTVAYVSPNGVPVVDINTANAAGLSVNQFTRYDVGTNGLVLNNGNTSQMARQSQLAGQVMANTNLSNEARIILNEVVSANRSTLAGFTEVVGGKADVIVANPYGITCSGCGYINTDRVTMTTGTPNFSPTGDLAGFTVRGGDILINGNGLNASAQQVLDLVARSVKLDAQVNVPNLGITTGANQWDYISRSVTGATTAAGAAPAYAIDSTALGGMYAGRIRIVATEAGVGVRMLGDAAASSDDFTLDAAGKVEIDSKISAKRDLALSTTSTDASALALNNASLTAQNNLTINASQGGTQILGSALVAGQNLALNAQTLSDSSSTASVQDNNKRYAGANTTVNVAQAANINGTSWGAGSALNATAGSLGVGGAGAEIYSNGTATLTATAGDLALNTATVSAQNDLTVTANAGAILAAAAANQGVQSTAGNVILNAATGINNAGVIDAKVGNVTVRANGGTSNSGTLHSGGNLDVADKAGGQSSNFTNTGTVLADGSATIAAQTLSNTATGKLQGSAGTSISSQSLNNAGLVVASSTAAAGNITTANLNNTGTLQSAQNLTVTANTQFQNSGTVLAQGNQTLNAAAGIQNSGTLQANGAQNLQLGSSTLNNTSSGKVLAQGVQQVSAGNLTNAGVLQAAGAQTLGITGAASNSGTVLGQSSQTANLGSLNNTGTWQANQGGTITATGGVTNTGAITLGTTAGKNGSLTAATVNNQAGGNIQSAGNLTVGITGALLNNAGKIIAANNLGLQATGSNVAVTNANNAYLQAGGTLTLSKANTASLDNQAGGSLLANAVNINTTSLNNAGTLQGGAGGSTLQVANTFTNSGTTSLATNSAGSSSVTADSINNTGILQSQGDSTLNVGSALSNGGTIINQGNLTLRGTAPLYSITTTGRVESLATLDIKGQTAGNGVNVTVGNTGVLKGATLALNSQILTIQGDSSQGGMVNAGGTMTVNANQINMGGSKSRMVATGSAGTSTITVGNTFNNLGAIYAAANLNFTTNGALTNTTTGGIAAGQNLTVKANGGNFDNYGALYAGGNLTANANNTFTNHASGNAAQGTMDANGSISVTANNFINQSTVNAGSNINITINSGGIFQNNVAGDLTRQSTNQNDSGVVFDRQTSGWCVSCAYNPVRNYYHGTYDNVQSFVNFNPSNAFKPQIISGTSGQVLISGFSSGENKGGIISSGTININGNSPSATFVVDDLSLTTKHMRRDWNDLTKWYGVVGSAAHSSTTIENDTGFIPYTAADGDKQHDTTYGAGIFATNKLGMQGGSLTLAGGPSAGSVTPSSTAGTGSGSVGAGANGTTGSNAQGGVAGVSGAPVVSYGGLNIALPSNPNGYFVTNQNPNASYLVETNPMYAVGSNFVGSNYLADRYGYNPDQIEKRLGDSNYEAYLIRQQLIAQTGSNILNGQADEAAQMKDLMDNAVSQGKKIGLKWGQALTPEQVSKLSHDIVWMVEVTVDGQKVLAPVVYLSAGTKEAVKTGAVISAKDASLNLTSLTNSGGTISGSSSLDIVSKGDVKNLGGTITGGNVSVQSTEGSIINATQATTYGNVDYAASTVIGKTGGIHATGDLSLDAKKDIVNTGAQISAGGNADLKAGNAITFDTIENKTTTSTQSYSSDGMTSNLSKSTTATTQQIKSGLTVGGNLNMQAKKDITLAGTDVNVKGNGNIESTDGSVNVVARTNSTKTTSKTETSGFGVGGGLAGSQTVDHQEEHDRNVASNLNIGGNANVKAKQDITIQGSNVAVKGNGNVEAGGNVNILDGNDRDYSKTTTTTTTFLKVEKGQTTGSAEGKTQTATGAQAKGLSASAGASAGASAEAGSHSTGGLVLAQKSVETQTDEDVRSVGSKVSFGGDLKVKTGQDVTLRGSELAAGGNVDVDAKNVNVLAGENKKTSSNTNSTTKVGFMGESDNKASADVNAGAGAKAGLTGANATAKVDASAEASTENRLALVKVSKTTEDSLDVTHSASAIKSGGNMNIKAKESINTVGSSLESGGDMALKAKDMSFQDAQDVHEVKRSSDETSAGLYLDANGKASATAEAGAKVGGMSMNAKASASAGASVEGSVSAGLYGSNTRSNSVEGSTTAQTSSIKAGGNMTRTATNSIKDVGTKIEAGGDFEQSAQTITSLAAHDTTYASSNSETNTAKIGAYAEGSAGVSADASGSAGGMGQSSGKSTSVGAGIKATFDQEKDSSTSNSSNAVVSSIKAGGKIKSTSSGTTEMEGTQLKSGGDTELDASSLNYRAAANTTSDSSTKRKIGAELKVDIVNRGGSLEGSFGNDSNSSQSSTAVVGGIDAGGALKIKTKGDTRLEGTQVVSGGNTELDVGGNLRVDAARNTQSSDSKGLSVDASVSASKSGKSKSAGLSADGSYNQSHDEASQAVVSNMLSGGKMTIKTGGDASFEGANLGAKGDTELNAKGKVDFSAARDTTKSSSLDVSANIGGSYGSEGASKGKSGKATGPSSDKSGSFGVGVGKSSSETSDATGGSIASGGKLKITSGSDARFEGTDISAAGDASVAAKGNLNFDAAKSTSSSNSVDVSAGASGRKASGLASRSTESGGTAIGKAGKGTQNGTRTEAAANLGVGVSKKDSSTAAAGGISSGGNLTLSSGGNTTLEGTQVAADGKAAINAGGKVDFKAAESTSSNVGVDVGVGGKMLRTTGDANAALPASDPGLGTLAKKGITAIKDAQAAKAAKTAAAQGKPAPAAKPTPAASPKDPNAPRTEKEVSVNIGVDVGSSHTSQGGSISAGQGIEINAGQDMTLVGTQLNSGAGSTNLTAGGNVDLQAANSSSKSVGVNLAVGKNAEGAPDKNAKDNGARVNSSSSSQGVSIQGQGNLTINSAGAVKMEGSKADMGGKAQINAVKGIEKKSAEKDTQSSIGLGGEKPKTPANKADKNPDPKAKDTKIQADGGTKEKSGAAAQAAVAAKLKAAAGALKQSQQEANQQP